MKNWNTKINCKKKTKLFKEKGEKPLIVLQRRIRGFFHRKLIMKINEHNYEIEHHKIYKKA